MMKTLSYQVLWTIFVSAFGGVDANDVASHGMTLELAEQIMTAAVSEARQDKAGGAIAIVDEGGHLVQLIRLDGTFAAASQVATGKARTAALFQKPTRIFEQLIVEKGRTSMVALPDFTPLQGGVPIFSEGRFVGAIGVSGAASAQQDDEIATAAAQSVEQSHSDSAHSGNAEPVHYFPAEDVRQAFQKGAPLLEVAGYKIHASRRDRAGQAEVHEIDTDIVYVLSGSATLVTGGKVSEGHEVSPHEIRGTRIVGGDQRELKPGDVAVIPDRTPHWFSNVPGEFLYYVVKVTSEAGQ